MSENLEEGRVYIKNQDVRDMLEKISRFDSLRTGTVNFTRTLYRLESEELARILATPEGKKFLRELEKEQGQT